MLIERDRCLSFPSVAVAARASSEAVRCTVAAAIRGGERFGADGRDLWPDDFNDRAFAVARSEAGFAWLVVQMQSPNRAELWFDSRTLLDRSRDAEHEREALVRAAVAAVGESCILVLRMATSAPAHHALILLGFEFWGQDPAIALVRLPKPMPSDPASSAPR